MIKRKKVGERENEKKEREVEFYGGLEPLDSAYIQMDRQTDQGPPPTDPCPASCPIKYN